MPKKHIAVTLDEELLEWLKAQIKNMRFASISHGVNWCVYKIKQMETQKENK